MNRWTWRFAGGTLAALLLLGPASTPSAFADEPPRLAQSDCQAWQPTAESSLVNAWQLQRLRTDSLWRMATGEGVTVAVIDTGVSTLGSPYLPATRINVYDMLEGTGKSDTGQIDCKHGTMVTSILAGGRSSSGSALSAATNFAGIAPDVKVVAYRTLAASAQEKEDGSQQERQSLLPTIRAVRDATKRKVDVINLSQAVGADEHLEDYRQAINEALRAGIVVVAAAGNAIAGLEGPLYPGAFDGVISVGISNLSDAGDTNTYPSRTVAVGAPGRDLVALLPSENRENPTSANQAYALEDVTGTSYAAPIVSGIVALMIQYERELYGRTPTPAEVKQRLIDTADPPAAKIPDPYIGNGIVNPIRALIGVEQGAPISPAPKSTVPSPKGTAAAEATGPLPMVGIGMGISALILVTLGLVAAIAIPAARRSKGS